MTSQLVPHPSSNTTPPTPECHVEVRPSPTSGNGLFATKDIPAGSTILLKPRPLIGELDLPRLAESCHNCFLWSGCVIEGGEIEIKACTGCKKVKYCSKVCFFVPITDMIETLLMYHSIHVGMSEAGLDQIP